ncbi:MAG: zf-TFIIB domain-containing protein, partial [Thermoplasmata archaeon]|nr:zf-TFIIB domain-containing protein [Thermoplasmata archaeon]
MHYTVHPYTRIGQYLLFPLGLSLSMSIKKKLDAKTKDCPRCWVTMEKERLEVFGPDIEVDRCPQCQGVWFDPGELSRAVGKKVGDYLTKHIGTRSESQLV